MDQWVVYILSGDRYYIGSTNNLERRLEEHLRGATHSTRRIGKRLLYGYIQCSSKQEARDLERSIKKSGHYDRWIDYNKEKIMFL